MNLSDRDDKDVAQLARESDVGNAEIIFIHILTPHQEQLMLLLEARQVLVKFYPDLSQQKHRLKLIEQRQIEPHMLAQVSFW